MASDSERRWIRRLVTVAVVIALFIPVLRDRDGLPLSTYPMYAGTRSEIQPIVTAMGVSESGDFITLSMPEIADSRDPLVVQAFLNDAVRRGDTDRVCSQIARRVDPGLASIEIATELHNVVNHVRGETSLMSREIHSRCSVPSR